MKRTIIHTEREIVRAMSDNCSRSKKEVFADAYHNTRGAARKAKLEKAWKKLRGENKITTDASKRYVLTYA